MSNVTPKALFTLAKNSVTEFLNNNSLRLAAALAYNTIFSLPPLLFIILMAVGAFFGEKALTGELYNQTKDALGPEAAQEIQTMINNLNAQENKGMAKLIGYGTMIFAATTFFITLQESLNTIWNIKAKPENGIMLTIKNRFLSFGLILSIGFLMLASFVISAALSFFTDQLHESFSGIAVILFKILDIVVSVGVITVLFALIYKYLPDAIIRWKDVWIGSFITAVLFVLGKFLIGWYLGFSDVGSAYGVAGSIIIILVWIYYSSLIVFFGAEYTQQYSKRFGAGIRPKDYAVRFEVRELRDVHPDDKKAGRPLAEGRFRK